MRILVSLFPFAEADPGPLTLLRSSGHEVVVNALGRRMTEADLIREAAESDALICGTEPVTARVIESAPKLKIVARVGSGYDSVDIDSAKARNVLVTYVPDGPCESVAELTLGLILCALRGINRSDSAMRNARWERPLGRLLGGRVVGVAGVSRVGQAVCRKLMALDCVVLGHDLLPRKEIGIPFVSKEELLARSEILSLHLSLTPQTQGWLGAEQIRALPKGAILINTARGGLVDEAALHQALVDGHIAHAAFDVYEREPYQGSLRALPNVTLTAHIGSMTVEARIKMELDASRSVLDVLSGQRPPDRVIV